MAIALEAVDTVVKQRDWAVKGLKTYYEYSKDLESQLPQFLNMPSPKIMLDTSDFESFQANIEQAFANSSNELLRKYHAKKFGY